MSPDVRARACAGQRLMKTGASPGEVSLLGNTHLGGRNTFAVLFTPAKQVGERTAPRWPASPAGEARCSRSSGETYPTVVLPLNTLDLEDFATKWCV